VYDLENPDNKPIEEINLSEGETVDIRYDWEGERSKCGE
jgi:predicted DNA-binding antitoxin AbrB/MazE fold protein